eukprot:14968202-Alexandrium_andersonii.AAC.1
MVRELKAFQPSSIFTEPRICLWACVAGRTAKGGGEDAGFSEAHSPHWSQTSHTEPATAMQS